MLNDFFKLNGDCDEFNDVDELKSALRNSNDLRNVIFLPARLTLEDLDDKRDLFTDITFNNVSFRETAFHGITFRRCVFEACLFMSTRFIDCEFHQCKFVGCNPLKIEFKNTYVDPEIFVGMLDKKKRSNIGVHLFQQLHRNAIETEQPKFSRTAEFNMRKWQRYDLDYKYPGWKKFTPGCFGSWSTNLLSYLFVGYGIRGKFWVFWAVLLGVLSAGTNFIWWESLEVVGRDNADIPRDFINVLFYTVTTLGNFGHLAPGSNVGKLVFIIQAGSGLFIVGLFLRWLIRQALR